MKISFLLVSLLTVFNAFAIDDYSILKKEDQPYFKNESFDGQNKLERIDMNVKEINKLYGEVAAMKADIAQLKKEIEILKASK
jgi:hypothetical protein